MVEWTLRKIIKENIKHYQDTLSYASSKVDYNMGQNMYMLPSDMNLKIKTGTTTKFSYLMKKFSLGKNDKVNLMVPVITSYKVTQTATSSNGVVPPCGSHAPNISHKLQEPKTITHNDEKIALVLFLAGGLPYGIFFNKMYGSPAEVHFGSCLTCSRDFFPVRSLAKKRAV